MNKSTIAYWHPKFIMTRERLYVWLIGLATLFVFFYVLLCTYAWNIVYGLFFAYMAGNMPNYLAVQSPWCEPGDWVLETFQPMVSDKAMIEHLNENYAEMTQLAELVAHGRHVDTANKYGPTPEYAALTKKLNISGTNRSFSWAERPYSMEEAVTSHNCYKAVDEVLKPATDQLRQKAWEECRQKDAAMGRDLQGVSIEPWFGKTHAQYFCSLARNSFKKYVYYPGGAPKVENGQLVSMPSYQESHRVFASGFNERTVSSTDIDPRGKGAVLRQIDERWFISRY